MAFAALEAALTGSVVVFDAGMFVLLPFVQGGVDIGVVQKLDKML